MTTVLLGAPLCEGASRTGAEAGPQALRAAGLRQMLEAGGRAVDDAGNLSVGDLAPVRHRNAAIRHLAEVAAWSHAIAGRVAALPKDCTPVLLGGDHSLSIGSLNGAARRARVAGRPLFVLWIDAHPDCHTLDTTTSGHLHGTPVAYATGAGDFGPAFPVMEAPILPDHVCMLGIRSIDPAEQALIARSGYTVHSAAAVAECGVEALLAPFLASVEAAGGLLHVSFDADALDPAWAPGVGTPVADGLLPDQACRIMAMARESGAIGSLDLVEVNPFLDRDRRTARLMVDLAGEALGQRGVARRRQSA
jgi:arginase